MRITAFARNEKTQVMLSIIVELLIIGILGNLLLWVSNTFVIQNPSKPIFRLIGSVIPLLILAIFLFIKRPSIQELGLSYQNIRPQVRKYYIIGLILIILLLGTSYLIMDFFSFTMNLRFGLTAPIFEELIFRGYIWHRLKNSKHDDISIIFITGALFGLFHLAGYYEIAYATSFFKDAPPLFKILQNKVLINTGYGFLLGFIRYKSKNLYLSYIIHSIGNIIGA